MLDKDRYDRSGNPIIIDKIRLANEENESGEGRT